MYSAALTILLSSFLLFLVQPILAKQVLPWFGGSAGVWTVCLVFFQCVLLLGYAYAHWLTRRDGHSRNLRYTSRLLVLSCVTLPIIPGAFWKSAHGAPEFQILGLLATTIGLPYFLLAVDVSTLAAMAVGQRRRILLRSAPSIAYSHCRTSGRWWDCSAIQSRSSRISTLRVQAWVWSIAYALFVAVLVSISPRKPPPRTG